MTLHGRRHRGTVGFIVAAGLVALLAGCAPQTGVHDPYALSQARKVAVMPVLGAPALDGHNAGLMQAGVLITQLANLKRFGVEGPGNLRRAYAAETDPDPFSRSLQTRLAKDLKIDLLVVAEVTDYRFWKETKSRGWLFGSNQWTETTYRAGVNVRFVTPDDGRLVYTGAGMADSRQGYGPAVLAATQQALNELKLFLAKQDKLADVRSGHATATK